MKELVDHFIAHKTVGNSFRSELGIEGQGIAITKGMTFGEWFENFTKQVKELMPIECDKKEKKGKKKCSKS